MSSLSFVFCQKNLELHSQSVYDKLKQEYPEVALEVKDCVGAEYCSLCKDVPFAIRNNSVLYGRDPRELYQKMERGLEFLKKDPLPGTISYQESGKSAK